MARFFSYAEVLTRDHVMWRAYDAGITDHPPGVILQGILDGNGGAYQYSMYMGERFREQARRLSELPGNEEFARIAQLDRVPISLEHLRDIDPQTRIVCGYGITVDTDAESLCMGQQPEGPSQPGTVIPGTSDPEHPWRYRPE